MQAVSFTITQFFQVLKYNIFDNNPLVRFTITQFFQVLKYSFQLVIGVRI